MPSTPLSIREQKLATSLQHKKWRNEEHLFIAEGYKVVKALLPRFTPHLLIFGAEHLEQDKNIQELYNQYLATGIVRIATDQQLKKITLLELHTGVVALLKQNEPSPSCPIGSRLALALDAIQNPGNMGTIIRLCDWLGVQHLICGEGCVDIYNPKVVQATAGALGNVHCIENVNLPEYLSSHFSHIIGTKMEGTPYSHMDALSPSTVIVMGNEGHGISEEVDAVCHRFTSIPCSDTTVGESLNVSVSTAIILSNFVNLQS